MIRTECPECGHDLYAESVRLVGYIPLDRLYGGLLLNEANYTWQDVHITCDDDDGHIYRLEDLAV